MLNFASAEPDIFMQKFCQDQRTTTKTKQNIEATLLACLALFSLDWPLYGCQLVKIPPDHSRYQKVPLVKVSVNSSPGGIQSPAVISFPFVVNRASRIQRNVNTWRLCFVGKFVCEDFLLLKQINMSHSENSKLSSEVWFFFLHLAKCIYSIGSYKQSM